MSVCFFGVENTRRTGIEFVDIFTCVSGDSATRQRQTSTIQMMPHAVAARNTDRWWWCRSEEAIPTLEYCSKHGCDSKKKVVVVVTKVHTKTSVSGNNMEWDEFMHSFAVFSIFRRSLHPYSGFYM